MVQDLEKYLPTTWAPALRSRIRPYSIANSAWVVSMMAAPGPMSLAREPEPVVYSKG